MAYQLLYFIFRCLSQFTATDLPNIHKTLQKPPKFIEDESSNSDQKYANSSPYDVSASSDDFESETNTFNSPKIKRIQPSLPKSKKIEEQKEYIENLGKKLNEALDLKDKDIASVVDKKAWDKLYKFLELNLDDFIINGQLSIELHIRYFLCCYIIAFIPGEFVFFYPALILKFFPKELNDIPVIGDAILELKKFHKFVKEQANKSFLTTFYFGRKNTLSEDLKFLITIPINILRDPGSVITELLEFEIRSEGYIAFKQKNKDK